MSEGTRMFDEADRYGLAVVLPSGRAMDFDFLGEAYAKELAETLRKGGAEVVAWTGKKQELEW